MSWKTTSALLSALLLLPAAHAIGITADSDETLTAPVGGSVDVPFTVTVDCASDVLLTPTVLDVITAGGTYDVLVTPTVPEWASAEAVTVEVDATACVTGALGASTSISAPGTITVNANSSAPGMTPSMATLEAGGDTADQAIQVDYSPGYELRTNVTFPLEVPEEGTTFTGTLHLFGNARSMAMFEVMAKGECVGVAGIPEFYTVGDEEIAGDMEFMLDFTVTVTPCSGEWTEDSYTFKTWSHFLDDGANKTPDEEIVWTFTPAAATSDESEGSPGFGIFAGVALLGAAFALRRRD